MDIKSINANVNRLLSNIWAIITFLKEFTVDGAKDVSITYINEDGSESVKTINNIAKQNEIFDSWKNNFLTEDSKLIRSHARLNPDLTLASMLIPFSNSYIKNGWLTVTKVQTVSSGVLWVDRTDEEKELLTLIGRAGVQYISSNFDIVKVEWTQREGHCLPYAKINALRKDSLVTCAAYVKHLRGEVPTNSYCNGLDNRNKWQLCGSHHGQLPLSYVNTHPMTNGASEGGAVLIALPATVDRYVDLTDPQNWAGILGE